jgi:hypothetical protein
MRCKIGLFGVVLVLFFYHSSGFAWHVSRASMETKVQSPPPAWMAQGIQRDFAGFKGGFSRADISNCIEELKQMQGIEVAGIVLFGISQDKLSCEPLFPLSAEQRARCDGFMSAVNQLGALFSLPSLDFLISFNRSFDRPLFLTKTSVPVLAISKETHNSKVVLIPRLWDPDREMHLHVFCNWQQKAEKALWRGSATDGFYGFYDWDCRPRARLALHSRHRRDLVDMAFIPSSDLDNYMTAWMQRLDLVSSFAPSRKQAAYKYLISIDGKSSPSSFEWQLFSGSVVLKGHSNRIEWFYHALSPGRHFVPFNPRGDDLIDKVLWLKSHDKKAKQIAENGYIFAMHHLLDEEALTYLYHVIQSYSLLYTDSIPCSFRFCEFGSAATSPNRPLSSPLPIGNGASPARSICLAGSKFTKPSWARYTTD